MSETNAEPRHPTPIEIGSNEVSFTVDGARKAFEPVPLPEEFLEWVVRERRTMYDHLERGAHVSFFGAHLPVMVSFDRHGAFPLNTGNKGVGLLPRDEDIEAACADLARALELCRDLPAEESLALRLAAVRGLLDPHKISNKALVTLEIFERQTFANVSDYPIATLHYAGGWPEYRSFQIDTVVEVLTPEHVAYRYAFLNRRLFEYERFHITQSRFPYAYRFHPVGVRDKTPFARK